MRKIYFNGNIITLEENKKTQSILIEDGIIKELRNLNEILNFKDNGTQLIDLKRQNHDAIFYRFS